MYSIDTSYIKKSKKPFIMFVVFGLLFLVLCITLFLVNHYHGKVYDGKAKSTMVSVDKINNVEDGTSKYVSKYIFTAKDGKEYTCDPNDVSDTYPGTNNKEVYYETKNPTHCMVNKHMKYNALLLIFAVIPFILSIIGMKSLKRINIELKALEILNRKGKLVKNLPYLMDYTGTFSKGAPVKRPVIRYVLPNGAVLPLYGYKRKDRTYQDEGGFIDLVLDEDNTENYFMDFNIDRLTGNLPTDFYKAPDGKVADKKGPSSTIEIPKAEEKIDINDELFVGPQKKEEPKVEENKEAPAPSEAPKTEVPAVPEEKKEEVKSDAPAAPEPPKAPETPKVAEPVKVEEPKVVEPVKVEEVKSDAPSAPEAPKAPEPVKVEAPKVAEPVKVEEVKSDAPSAPEAPKAPEAPVVPEPVKVEEPKTPEPVKVEESKSDSPSAPEPPKGDSPTAPSAPEVPKVQEIQEIK